MLQYSSEDLYVETNEKVQFIDITKNVQEAVSKLKILNGVLMMHNMHTTSGIWINEKEGGLLKDMKKKLEKFAGDNEYYEHDDFKIRTDNLLEDGNERENAQAHLRSTFFNTSISISVKDSKLDLGKWQSIMYAELDGPQKRRIKVIAMGDFDN